jgi:competence protein ComEA
MKALLVASIATLLVVLASAPTATTTSQKIGPAASADPAQQPQPININRATLGELRSLPGIGPATAQKILEYRAKNPPFRRIEELLIIRGISRGRLERIRNRITVR